MKFLEEKKCQLKFSLGGFKRRLDKTENMKDSLQVVEDRMRKD